MRKLTLFFTLLLAAVSGYTLELSPGLTPMNMPEGVTSVSHSVYQIHMIVLTICTIVGVLVFGMMFYAIANHRKDKGHKAEQFHENVLVEIVWTIIPALILIIMAVPATKVLIDMHDTSKADLTIKITGYQWKWQYHYLEDEIDFFSNTTITEEERKGLVAKPAHYMQSVDNELVIPIHKKVRFLLTSNDVIHSWWVPALSVKQDAVPGFINEKWARVNRPGVYYGQCTELCGVNHGFMPVVVRAVSQAEYDQWVSEQKGNKVDPAEAAAKTWTMDELMAVGKETYNLTCAACHKPTGDGAPPMFPSLKGVAITTQASELEHNINTILFGRSGTAMQAFGQQMDIVKLAGIMTYIRNAWGNDTGDVVQPKVILQMLNNNGK